jgi:alpha-glucosidase
MLNRMKVSAFGSSFTALALLLATCLAVFPQQKAAQTVSEKRTAQRNAADWWKYAVYYEVYPRSFFDTNRDGVGDLNGITAKLDYLADLGVDALWITPFFPSPQVDFGYDVSDYEAVDPQFGTLADFDRLVSEAHKRNIKVICDFVINHTSDQHPFFKASRSSRNNPKRDWYVWRDAKPNGDPPNNWSSAFGAKAWTFDDKTKQYYYHYFYPQQPDLNWRNPLVERAMFNSVRFWFRRGVDGFRVDAIDTLFEDPRFLDNPLTNKLRKESTTEYEQDKKYNIRQPENFEEFRRLRSVAAEFGPDRVLIGETYPPKVDDLLAYYGKQNDAFQLPFNFFLLKADKLDATAFRNLVAETERVLQGRPTTYVLSNHDNPRAFDEFGDGQHNDEIAKMLALMLLTLRGAPFFYYGEEIGMKTTEPERLEDVRDPVGKTYWPKYKGRDGERTPMQWTSGRNAGFSTAETTWLPVPATAKTRNVETMSKDPNSVLNFYKQAIRLRRASPALLDGDYAAIGDDSNVFAYRRKVPDQTVVVALNMSAEPRTLKLNAGDLGGEGKTLRVAISNLMRGEREIVNMGQLTLGPYEAVALEVTAN